MTKYHKLGSLHVTEIHFSQFCESLGSTRSRCWLIHYLVAHHSLVHRWCLLAGSLCGGWSKEPPWTYFIMVLISFKGLYPLDIVISQKPSLLNCHLGVRISIYEFGGDRNIQTMTVTWSSHQ